MHHRTARGLLDENLKHRPATPMTAATEAELQPALQRCTRTQDGTAALAPRALSAMSATTAATPKPRRR